MSPHDHSHQSRKPEKLGSAFITSIILNFSFVVVEVYAGLHIKSLSLLSDAGHNLADVGMLSLSLIAYNFMNSAGNERYTYGYKKTSVLVAFFNAVILLVTVGMIIYEAAHRLYHPPVLPGKAIALVAGAGILVNGGTALLFRKNKNKDLNIRSAYLHLFYDALISLTLVAGGIIITFTGWYWVDSALSIGVAITIVAGAFNLFKGSLRLSLDGVPANMNINDIRHLVMKIKGVKDIHHIHIWALSTTETAFTAHLVLADDATMEEEKIIKQNVKKELEHQNIHHITLETERENEECDEEPC